MSQSVIYTRRRIAHKRAARIRTIGHVTLVGVMALASITTGLVLASLAVHAMDAIVQLHLSFVT